MIYVYPFNDSFTIIYDKAYIDESLHGDLIEVESLPEGTGVLKRRSNGEFYYESTGQEIVQEPVSPVEPTPTPEPPVQETTEQKLERVLDELVIQRKHNEIAQQQNLILLDVNMTIYEELITLQDRLNNA